ncbi:hypothetical protein C8R44DRAFT_879326 [Mycena epipterygia]|nr:hypothetical protein C8R44DRAFT_879326 [Mycena epipterygia]
MAEAEDSHFEGIEAGMLSGSDVHTEVMLSRLQIKVSSIREATFGILCQCGNPCANTPRAIPS